MAAWDSLGEGLAGSGRPAEAAAAFRKSLEHLPGNANAKDWLAKLGPPPEGIRPPTGRP